MNKETQQESLVDQTENRAQLQITRKWGDVIGKGGNTGFVVIPEALLRGQHRLGLSATDMMVLINVLMHWWYHDKPPFPGNTGIAQRMGVSKRTVQRSFKTLEEKGLIHRDIRKFTEDDRSEIDDESGELEIESKTPYDSRRYLYLNGLVNRLQTISEELRAYRGER